jgi:6-pyruvoyltetrahydropterin/6-carboxytetrahydropterin synthase
LDGLHILGEDDPALDKFKELDDMGIVQLRVLPAVGTEKFAEYIYKNLNEFVKKETNGRVRVTQVEFREHEKNSAIYTED